MFGKVKKVLGIETVKLELLLPEDVDTDAGIVSGILKLTSLSDKNVIQSIHVEMTETYTRGRGDKKRTNDYTVGVLTKKEYIKMEKDDIIEIPFVLDFKVVKSEMDKMEETNFITSGIVKIAKKIKGVSSVYNVKAEVIIKGSTLHPFAVKSVNLI